MAKVITYMGIDEAVVGTMTNSNNKDVLVYDLMKVFDVFQRQNKTQEDALDWITEISEHTPLDQAPIFITLDPSLGKKLVAARGRPN